MNAFTLKNTIGLGSAGALESSRLRPSYCSVGRSIAADRIVLTDQINSGSDAIAAAALLPLLTRYKATARNTPAPIIEESTYRFTKAFTVSSDSRITNSGIRNKIRA